MFFNSKETRRRRLLAEPFPRDWLACLEENVFLYRLLSEADQGRLRDLVTVFIAEKFWEGCAGLAITDEMRVTVAANACVTALGFDDYYFDGLRTILIYRGGFLRTIEDHLGSERPLHLVGEAKWQGPVILSWWQT